MDLLNSTSQNLQTLLNEPNHLIAALLIMGFRKEASSLFTLPLLTLVSLHYRWLMAVANKPPWSLTEGAGIPLTLNNTLFWKDKEVRWVLFWSEKKTIKGTMVELFVCLTASQCFSTEHSSPHDTTLVEFLLPSLTVIVWRRPVFRR